MNPIVLELKNMYETAMRYVNQYKIEENNFSKENISVRKQKEVEMLPIGELEIKTREGVVSYLVIPNDHDEFYIGSSPKCDLVLNAPYIQDLHCYIEYDDEQEVFVLQDNASLEGIYDHTGRCVDTLVLEEETEFSISQCVHVRWKKLKWLD